MLLKTRMKLSQLVVDRCVHLENDASGKIAACNPRKVKYSSVRRLRGLCEKTRVPGKRLGK